ncbi:unnamed protein product, partial [Polarella glacialis]
LEFKAEMKQMRWQADWQAVRHLEESNLLGHPPGSVDGLGKTLNGAESLQDPGNLPSLPRSRSRVAEALFGAIAASQDAQPRGDTGTGELFPRPSYKAIWNESATQVCQEPAPAKSRIDSQLAERVAADLEDLSQPGHNPQDVEDPQSKHSFAGAAGGRRPSEKEEGKGSSYLSLSTASRSPAAAWSGGGKRPRSAVLGPRAVYTRASPWVPGGNQAASYKKVAVHASKWCADSSERRLAGKVGRG